MKEWGSGALKLVFTQKIVQAYTTIENSKLKVDDLVQSGLFKLENNRLRTSFIFLSLLKDKSEYLQNLVDYWPKNPSPYKDNTTWENFEIFHGQFFCLKSKLF